MQGKQAYGTRNRLYDAEASPASVQWTFLLPFTACRAPSLRRMQTSRRSQPYRGMKPDKTEEKQTKDTRGGRAERKDFRMQILFRFLLRDPTPLSPNCSFLSIRPTSQPFSLAFFCLPFQLASFFNRSSIRRSRGILYASSTN